MLNVYKAFIIDFDGTFYAQTPVRIFMALWLVFYYFLHPFKIRELLILREYRKLRETRFKADNENFDAMQINAAAMKYNFAPEKAIKIIDNWLNKRPLKLINFFRRRKFINFIKMLQAGGAKIIVYSDYPVNKKLAAINFAPERAFYSGDKLISCMKPDERGLINIINLIKIKKREILYIGDRYDRDGLCAKSAGVDYIDIHEFIKIYCK